MESENAAFDPRRVQALRTPEEIRNYIVERIEIYHKHLQKCPPPPTDQITSVAYMRWERVMLMLHGRAVEASTLCQALGHITPEEFTEFKMRLMATTLARMANVQLGVPE